MRSELTPAGHPASIHGGTRATRTALSVVALSAAAMLLPRGAGRSSAPTSVSVTVSNSAPARASAIEVSSTGWAPGVVVIDLADRDRRRARPRDRRRGRRRARRGGDPGRRALAAATCSPSTGRPLGGVPAADHHGAVRGRHRPAAGAAASVDRVFVLAALAAVLLLASARSERDRRRLTVAAA